MIKTQHMKYPVPGKEFCYFFLHFLVEASTLEKPLAAENGPGAFPVSGKEFGIFRYFWPILEGGK